MVTAKMEIQREAKPMREHGAEWKFFFDGKCHSRRCQPHNCFGYTCCQGSDNRLSASRFQARKHGTSSHFPVAQSAASSVSGEQDVLTALRIRSRC